MSGSTNSQVLTLATPILFQWLQKPQAITFQNALLPAKLLRKVCLFCAKKYLICMFHGHKERALHPLAGSNPLLLLWLKTHRASRWGRGSEAISYNHLTHACILQPLTQTASQYDSIVPIILLFYSSIVLLTMKIETMIHKIEAKHLQDEMCGLIKRHACTIIRRHSDTRRS